MGGTVELFGSFRPLPRGGVRAAGDNVRIAVTLHLKHPDEPQHPMGTAEDFARLLIPSSRGELARERARQFKSVRALLSAFAEDHGMKLGLVRPMLRTARIGGTVAQMRKAFGAALHLSDNGRTSFIGRSGSLHLPDSISPWTRAVLGFGSNRSSRAVAGRSTDGPGLWPRQIAALYGLSIDARADGQCIGIVAQGGTYQLSDLESAARESDVPVPIVVPPPSPKEFDTDSDSNTELALDLQVLAGVAPGAKLVIYSVPNEIENMVDALHLALADTVNAPHIVLICWGSSEEEWPDDVRATFDAALRDAITLRVAVVAAAGDYLATGGMLDGKAHVFYPASSPYVLSCGGTAPTLDGARRTIMDEAVWNEPIQAVGTGGGISNKYMVPDYQSSIALPPSVNEGGGPGRGVPDVAAAAWSDPGYAVVLGGVRIAEAGTSAATPLWAGLLALANAQRSTPLGFPNHALYTNRDRFRKIVTGNNATRGIGYSATPGWNACAGLGVPNWTRIIEALAAF